MSTPTVTHEPRIIRNGTDAAAPQSRPAASTIGQLATYWLSIVGIYVIQGGLWYYAAEQKIIAGDFAAPAGIEKAFAGSFVDSFPGVGVAWAVIATCQALIVLGLAASLARREFLPTRSKPILMGSLAGSVVVLGMLLFGQSMIAEHDAVASLFTYGAGTLVMMAAVLALSPGGRAWGAGSPER